LGICGHSVDRSMGMLGKRHHFPRLDCHCRPPLGSIRGAIPRPMPNDLAIVGYINVNSNTIFHPLQKKRKLNNQKIISSRFPRTTPPHLPYTLHHPARCLQLQSIGLSMYPFSQSDNSPLSSPAAPSHHHTRPSASSKSPAHVQSAPESPAASPNPSH
jgi:hypothetical protein